MMRGFDTTSLHGKVAWWHGSEPLELPYRSKDIEEVPDFGVVVMRFEGTSN